MYVRHFCHQIGGKHTKKKHQVNPGKIRTNIDQSSCVSTCTKVVKCGVREVYIGDGVHLIEEQDARSCRTGLVEQLAHVCLRLSEPHGKKLGACDRKKIQRDAVAVGVTQRLQARFNHRKHYGPSSTIVNIMDQVQPS